MLQSSFRMKEWLLPSSQPLDKTHFWTYGSMQHWVWRSWPQEKAGSGLAASTDHCAEPVMDQWMGKLKMGLTANRVVVSASEWGRGRAELLLGLPWLVPGSLQREKRCSCPDVRMLAPEGGALDSSPVLMELSHLLCAKDSPWLTTATQPI